MSIPPPSSGRRQPASFIARMKRYWLGGTATFLSVAGAFVLLSYIVTPTYESTGVIEVTAQTPLDSKAVAEEIRASISDSGRLEELARHPEPGEDPSAALNRARRSFQVSVRSDRAFSIAFEGRRPEWAQHGSEVLVDAVLEHFARDVPRQDEKQTRADLEKKTRELADFVTLHPDFSPGPGAARPESSAQPTRSPSLRDDPTLSVLRQERARLEARLAGAQSESAQGSDKNPYDDEADSDVAAIGRQLAKVRLAIAAHQKAISERAAAPPAPSPEVAAEAARRASLDSEWRRLVKAVVDAQSEPPPPKRDVGPVRTVKILEQPKLPSRPVKPNRSLVAVVGLLLGAAAGGAWALARVSIVDRSRRRAMVAREQVAAAVTSASPPARVPELEGAKAVDPRDAIGLAATVAIPARSAGTLVGHPPVQEEPAPLSVAEPHKRSFSPNQGTASSSAAAADGPKPDEARRSSSPPPEQRGRPGLRDMGTQRGMIDAAFVKAQTGATPQSLAQRVEGKPIVDVSRDRRSDPPPRGGEPRPQARSVTPPGPSSAPPITQRIGSPSDPANPDANRPDTSYSFVDRGWRASSKRASSRPPTRPPDRIESIPARGDAGSRSRPPSDPPLGAARSRPPSDPPLGATMPSAVPPAPARPSASPSHDVPHVNRTPPATPHARAEARDHNASDRPGATRPGWARPSPPPGIAGVAEVWSKVAGPPEPIPDDVVEPRSVPPTWSRVSAASLPSGQEGELSSLCDKLTELSVDKCFVIGVVSERSELDAKSQVAAALAMMVAEGMSRVLLMEGNFDWPAVHRQMAVSMPNFSGFSQQMHARTRRAEKKPWIVVRCSSNLDVLAEGIVRSPGVLYSQQFSEAIAELRRYYRVIVCDGPVVGGADAKPLDAVTDGLIVVAPSQRALMNSLDRAAKWFGHKQLLAAVPAIAPGK